MRNSRAVYSVLAVAICGLAASLLTDGEAMELIRVDDEVRRGESGVSRYLLTEQSYSAEEGPRSAFETNQEFGSLAKRHADARVVHLMPTEQQSAEVTYGSLSSWQRYYESYRLRQLEAGTAGQMLWWTNDPAIVSIFVESLGEHLSANERLLAEREREIQEGYLADSGAEYLQEIMELLGEAEYSMSSEVAFFESLEVSSQVASELGLFLRDQYSIESGIGMPIVPEGSIFEDFSRPLGRHVEVLLERNFLTMEQAQQQAAKELYAVAILEAARLKAEAAVIQLAAVDTAAELGIAIPAVDLQLVSEIDTLAEIKKSVAQVWASFVQDLQSL